MWRGWRMAHAHAVRAGGVLLHRPPEAESLPPLLIFVCGGATRAVIVRRGCGPCGRSCRLTPIHVDVHPPLCYCYPMPSLHLTIRTWIWRAHVCAPLRLCESVCVRVSLLDAACAVTGQQSLQTAACPRDCTCAALACCDCVRDARRSLPPCEHKLVSGMRV